MFNLPVLTNLPVEGNGQSQLFTYLALAAALVYFFFYYKKHTNLNNRNAAERRALYIKNHSDLSDEIRDAISEGKIAKDMKEEELFASIGFPERRKILTAEPAKTEVFTYPGIEVYMHMGIVQKWNYQKKILGL